MTEAKTNPLNLEFFEIYNPGCEAVSLANYFVSDEPSYPLLPTWGASPPKLGNLDAVVAFPDTAVLEPRSAAVVARDGQQFELAYGMIPDYALTDPGSSAPMNFIAYGNTQDMSLRNEGEPLALFWWDGATDLIQDVDIVIVGEAPPGGHRLIAKQVLAPAGIDGPDADSVPTRYSDDAATIPPMLVRDAGADATDGSYQRVAFEGSQEIAAGGNGVTGHDETSENTVVTWEQDVGTTPTPGAVPPALSSACP